MTAATMSATKRPNFFKRHFHGGGNGKADSPPSSPAKPAPKPTVSPAKPALKNPTSQPTNPEPRPHIIATAPTDELHENPQEQPQHDTPRQASITSNHTGSVSPRRGISTESGIAKVGTNGTARTDYTSNTSNTAVTSVSGISMDGDEPTNNASRGGAGGIKWAATYDVPKPRPRRQSSAASRGRDRRRSSIYMRADDGDFQMGVDAGVGSKARRLSIDVPKDVMLVNECKLEDHFTYLERRGKQSIGEGGAANVYKMASKTVDPSCTSKKKQFVAVKEFRAWDRAEETETEYVTKIKSEYAIAKSCDHENIVRTFELCRSGPTWYHVMEWCSLNNLTDLACQGYFRPVDRNCFFKQMIRGVDYLHSHGIAHRDLKADNLLLSEDGCLKIADFGTAEVFSGLHPGVRNCEEHAEVSENVTARLCAPGWVGSRPYMAPEIVQRTGNYDPRAVDVWSVGIAYLTMCFVITPWELADPSIKNYHIYAACWDDYYARYGDDMDIAREDAPLMGFCRGKALFARLDDIETMRLVCCMLHPDPKRRWSIRQALESKVVDEYECCQQKCYSGNLAKRQKKALHNHNPPKEQKSGFLQPSFKAKR